MSTYRRVSVAGMLLILAMTTGCGSSGVSAQQYASVLSSHQFEFQTGLTYYYADGFDLERSNMTMKDLRESYRFSILVNACKAIADDLNKAGKPASDIAELVAKTKEAFTKCQTNGPETKFTDFDEKYMTDAANIWASWIPYGVPK